MPKKTTVLHEKPLAECSDKELLKELVERWGQDIEHGIMAPCDVRDKVRQLLCDTLYCSDRVECPLCLE